MQVYAPINDAESEAKDNLYDKLQSVLKAVSKHDLLIVMGDWNAKVGQREGDETTIVKYPLSGGVRSRAVCRLLRHERPFNSINGFFHTKLYTNILGRHQTTSIETRLTMSP